MEGRLMSVIETNFGARIDPKRVALGSASNVKKQGAFFVFSIRVDNDDVREYSFSDRDRATAMRKVNPAVKFGKYLVSNK